MHLITESLEFNAISGDVDIAASNVGEPLCPVLKLALDRWRQVIFDPAVEGYMRGAHADLGIILVANVAARADPDPIKVVDLEGEVRS